MKKSYIQPSMAIAEFKGDILVNSTSQLETGNYTGAQSLLGNDRDSYDDEEDLW